MINNEAQLKEMIKRIKGEDKPKKKKTQQQIFYNPKTINKTQRKTNK